MKQTMQQQVKNKYETKILYIVHGTIYVLSLMLHTSVCASQTTERSQVNCDSSFMVYPTSGVKIERQSFDSLVGFFICKLKNRPPFSLDEYVKIIRIDNTISIYMLNFCDFNFELYQKFIDLFDSKVMSECIEKLNAVRTKGFGYYSREFDIEIGGVLERENSVYLLQ